jgi:P2-related tail formation protein
MRAEHRGSDIATSNGTAAEAALPVPAQGQALPAAAAPAPLTPLMAAVARVQQWHQLQERMARRSRG